MLIFGIGIISIVLIILIIFLAMYMTHISMVDENCKISGWGNYKQFKKEFIKYEWEGDIYHKTSVFCYKDNSQCHADIYKFNGIGMKMKTPWDYILTCIYIRKYIKDNKLLPNPDKVNNYKW